MSNNHIYYIIYQTTNKVNGKIYIGAHCTSDMDDGYIGSGKILKRAITKHGIEKFQREVLFSFDNKEQMYQKEKELVNEEFLERNDVYNLKLGGEGGNPGIVGAFKGRKHTEEAKMKIREASLRNAGMPHTEEARRKMVQNNAMKRPEIREKVANALRGKTHTEKHKNAVAGWNKGRIRVNNGYVCKSITMEVLPISFTYSPRTAEKNRSTKFFGWLSRATISDFTLRRIASLRTSFLRSDRRRLLTLLAVS